MSNDLKTLKDLENPHNTYEIEWLRAEAVKWIKSYRADYGFHRTAEAEFIEFFNLTEEDLK